MKEPGLDRRPWRGAAARPFVTLAAAFLAPFAPLPARAELDLRLGDLSQLQQAGRTGAWPAGVTAVAFATTSCNVGTENIPWLGPMAESHPGIAMQLYRELGGRFEQLGASWIVHGPAALPGNSCDLCTTPSDGTFLPPQCSNVHSAAIHADRALMGPRDEWDPLAGSWRCAGSHFAGGEPDCVRRHDGAGHDPVEHRLAAADADLGNPGATYYYEAIYLVPGDADRHDNLGSRRCTMVWSGSAWIFSTPAAGNPLVSGPALERWGERRTWATAAPGDGELLLAVQTSDLGGGLWRYEYALFNLDCARGASGFRVPVGGLFPSAAGFHDGDRDPSSDWSPEAGGGELAWRMPEPGAGEEANALDYGLLFNFRFEAPAPPGETLVAVDLHRPGAGSGVTYVPTTGPAITAGVRGEELAEFRLEPARPNPSAGRGVALAWHIPRASPVRLEIFTAGGRRVRVLAEGPAAAGRHEAAWDGTDRHGAPVAPGVYLARLSAEGRVTTRSLVIAR